MSDAFKPEAVIERFEHSHVAQLLLSQDSGSSLVQTSTDLDARFGHDLDPGSDLKEVSLHLAKAKREIAATYARELLAGCDDTPDKINLIGRGWSAFADWSINQALFFAAHSPALKRFFTGLPEQGEALPGLFILGLGKLGGRDLNYSSDVDLVAFFDADTFPVRPGEGKTDIAARLLKAVTQILTGNGAERVWRVDWRLRPDPSVTGLAMSAEAGEEFFFFKSAPWRRLAMMKSRIVAGDRVSGDRFLQNLTPFIWRKTLDFRAIEDIAGMKSRIHSEHPDLEGDRIEDTALETFEGFHTKLGSGGIREVEFITNAMQLVWGGRRPSLRTTNTLEALGELNQLGLHDDEKTTTLRSAYAHFRGLENRIQLMQDGHTHLVPKTKDEQELLALLYPDTNWKALAATTITYRRNTRHFFDDLFSREVKSSDPVKIPENLRDKLDQSALAVMEIWCEGFLAYGVNADARPFMTPLFETLVDLIDKSDTPDEDVVALDGFFRSLPPGGQYLRLLAEQKQLAGDILPPLTGGGAMANLLRHTPHVVDTLIQRGGRALTTPAERNELADVVFHQQRYEARLEAMRNYVNEMLYLIYLCVWRNESKPSEARQTLSEIAAECIGHCVKIVAEEYGNEGHLSVIGFGKLGMREMMPESDLDLVFLAHGLAALETEEVDVAHRFAERLKTALSAEMRGGKVYEIDTRLRPSGQSGAPTVRLATFRDHQMERAKTWEHLALVPAQFVHGPGFAQTAFEEVRHEVLSRKRDQKQLAMDAHAMLQMLREHRIEKPKSGVFALKLVPGGTMEAEYLLAFLVLKHANEHPELASCAYGELPRLIEKIDDNLAGLADDIAFLHDTHFCERLYGWTGKNMADIQLEKTPIRLSKTALEKKIAETCARISTWVDREIVKPSGKTKKSIEAHEQLAVTWAD